MANNVEYLSLHVLICHQYLIWWLVCSFFFLSCNWIVCFRIVTFGVSSCFWLQGLCQMDDRKYILLVCGLSSFFTVSFAARKYMWIVFLVSCMSQSSSPNPNGGSWGLCWTFKLLHINSAFSKLHMWEERKFFFLACWCGWHFLPGLIRVQEVSNWKQGWQIAPKRKC